MNKYRITLSLAPVFFSSLCAASDRNQITYGYDETNSEIYAINGNIKNTLKFDIDYTGNLSYYFDFLSDSPAIVSDGRSLHDFTTYTILNFNIHDFYIDCFYYNIKSKQNGLLVKNGVYGLNKILHLNYAKYIEEIVTDIEKDIDTLDTLRLFNGKIKYLAVLINNNTNRLVYKFYENKTASLNDDYSILIAGSDVICEVYTDSPWVKTKGSCPSQQIKIKSETIKNSKLSLIHTLPENIKTNKCLLFAAFRGNVHKAFFMTLPLILKNNIL